MDTVVIGAGISGLYTSILLARQGISVLVFDPRAGIYTRPGLIDRRILTLIKERLNLEVLPNAEKNVHLKDVERALYAYALKLNIRFENKEFVDFATGNNKGICVVNEEKTQEFLPCSHVFDCTGYKRILAHKINSLVHPSPFQITIITDVTIKQHFLAYVRMSEEDALRIKEFDPMAIAPKKYVLAMQRLQQEGWREFIYPQLRVHTFGKNKFAMYVECPNDLFREKAQKWLQTVLFCIGDKDIFYEELPPPQKYLKKPRLCLFKVEPDELNKFVFQDMNFPTVLIAGTGQMGADYRHGNALKLAFKSIDLMIHNLEKRHGEIINFYEKTYLLQLNPFLESHRSSLINFYKKLNEQAFHGQLYAKAIYQKLFEQGNDEMAWQSMVHKLDALITYNQTLRKYNTVIVNGCIQLSSYKPTALIAELIEIQQAFTRAYLYLAEDFKKERQDIKIKIFTIAVALNLIGDLLQQRNKFYIAHRAYVGSLSSYCSPPVASHYPKDETELYLKVIMSCRKTAQQENIFSLADEILAKYSQQVALHDLMKKILFHTIRGGIEYLEKNTAIDNVLLAKKIRSYCSNYTSVYDDIKTNLACKIATVDAILQDSEQQENNFVI
ncbi:FAD-dependent oxidoreductase [Legionella septentrionalis]|uniref:Uncharacterized protein n=1 Tax=Legionella septentrionalis TaxID=2498109 RepID=A0A433JHP6_9GAMM|nr:NAD(P)-binding protein [Legionella septentrionalis]RUQ82109.1 hypothetical protein EKM59_09025 [Legionella septentrionalis]